tara:strand:- start:1559 stop:2290 length:732 start_codon:yes stop_codon:yes gene_type:complete
MPEIKAIPLDMFPHDVDTTHGGAKYKEGRTVFLFKKLTVERDFDGQYGYGLKFVEDKNKLDEDGNVVYEGGKIWNIDGEYDKDQRKYLDYAGVHYQAGQIVNVQLVHEEYKKRDGTQGEARRIWGISLSDESPTELATPAAQATPAATVARSYDQNRPAALGMTANMLLAIENAGKSEEILGITPEAAKAIIKDVMTSNLEGRPLDEALEPLHSLLVPVVEEESSMVEAALDAGAEKVEKLEW